MIKFICSLLTIMLCIGLTSVSAQQAIAKNQVGEEAVAKALQNNNKMAQLKALEDKILEANQDEMAVKLINAEREYASLMDDYKNNKFGKTMKEMTHLERKDNMLVLINDEQYINLRKQTDIAKIEKEEYLLENNKEYADLVAKIEKKREERIAKAKAKAAKNGKAKGNKMGKGKKTGKMKGKKAGTPRGLLKKR